MEQEGDNGVPSDNEIESEGKVYRCWGKLYHRVQRIQRKGKELQEDGVIYSKRQGTAK